MIVKGFSAAVRRSSFIFVLIAAVVSVFPFGGVWKGDLAESSAANFQITLRDSITGERVSGDVTSVSDNSFASFPTDAAGKGIFHLAAGRNDLEIAAPGYN